MDKETKELVMRHIVDNQDKLIRVEIDAETEERLNKDNGWTEFVLTGKKTFTLVFDYNVET